MWYWGDEPNSRGQRAPANHRAEVQGSTLLQARLAEALRSAGWLAGRVHRASEPVLGRTCSSLSLSRGSVGVTKFRQASLVAEGLDPEDLEGLAAGQRDAQVTEWRNMAEAHLGMQGLRGYGM